MSEKGQERTHYLKEQIPIPKSQTLKYFWEGIATGKYIEPSVEEIERTIDEVYFAKEPLNELTPEQEGRLRDKIRERLTSRPKSLRVLSGDLAFFRSEDVRPEWLPTFTGYLDALGRYDGAYLPDPHLKSGGLHLFDLSRDYSKIPTYERVQQLLKKEGFGPIIPKRKIELFHDPLVYPALSFPGGNKITTQGVNRDLISYGYEENQFRDILAGIRERGGKSKLRVLDLGGGMGTALGHAQRLDPNVETINLTIDEELASIPTDQLILAPAERIPRELEESVDLVIEYIAAKYFLYPGLVFRNIVNVLAPEGEAHFDHYPIQNIKEGFGEDMRALYSELKQLIGDGILEVYFDGVPFKEATLRDGKTPVNADNFHEFSARVKIIKKKSLK